jgi:hypothetical protein
MALVAVLSVSWSALEMSDAKGWPPSLSSLQKSLSFDEREMQL